MNYIGISKSMIMKNLNISPLTYIVSTAGILCIAFDLMPQTWAGVISGVLAYNLMQNHKKTIDKKLKLVYNRVKRF